MDLDSNIPMAGFIKQARDYKFQLIPLIWCAATPSGIVTKGAADKIANEILNGLKNLDSPIDALYIDFHGAMVAESQEDVQGELLTAIRKIIGNKIPIVASLDLHANVTPLMFEKTDGLIAYKTYPHTDMAETGERAANFLHQLLFANQPIAKAYRQLPFLIPITAQCTMTDPALSLYDRVSNLPGISNSLCMGFPLSDSYHTGPTVISYAKHQPLADEQADHIYQAVLKCEKDFQLDILQPDDAIQLALKLNAKQIQPVILADTQDNSGCGGSNDTTGLLHALVAAKVPDATIVLMTDERIATQAYDRGVGKTIKAHFKDVHNKTPNPITLDCKIIAIGDGNIIGTGPYYKNCQFQLGPMACLAYNGIKIVVACKKIQAADQALLHHLHIDTEKEKIIILKSSVHFRADFSKISSHIYMVEAPGLNIANLKNLTFKNLRKGMRY